jgi:DNA (cytosine-5)-methyltransferase 1
MRTMHLFAGAGGGLLADLILGHTPIVAVEWDRYACQVLRERAAEGWFPELHVWEGDVRLFDPSEYTGKVDCIHAGFPCQDVSVAGKQMGVSEGTRSGLYREVLRIAGEMGCPDLFLENVADIVSNGLGTVIGDLAALGYECRWLCIQASDVGANHERDRWFLYATAGNSDRNRQSVVPIHDEAQKLSKSGYGNAPHSHSTQREGGRVSIRASAQYADFGGCPWWKDQPAIHGVDDGVAFGSHRLKAIGNGQVPLQAAVAWKLLGGE